MGRQVFVYLPDNVVTIGKENVGRIHDALWHPLVLQRRHAVSASLHIDASNEEVGRDHAFMTDCVSPFVASNTLAASQAYPAIDGVETSDRGRTREAGIYAAIRASVRREKLNWRITHHGISARSDFSAPLTGSSGPSLREITAPIRSSAVESRPLNSRLELGRMRQTTNSEIVPCQSHDLY